MLKSEVVEVLNGIENMLDLDVKGQKVFEIAKKAVKAFDYDERDEITVKLKAIKSPEGENTYYCELETGERLVIRDGELEGIYEPNENKYQKAFDNLAAGMQCPNCPARDICEERNKKRISVPICSETLFDYLVNAEK